MNHNFLYNASSFSIRAPITTSLWPPMYLVTECITISAPISIGFWRYGEAKVLSTQNKALISLAILPIASISTTCIVGLVGVSIQISFVLALAYSRTISGFD